MTTWQFLFESQSLEDVQVFLQDDGLATLCKRTIAAGIKHYYQCSQYRKYPTCKRGAYAMIYPTGRIEVFEKDEHDHSDRIHTTRLRSPVRECIEKGVGIGLKNTQLKRSLEQSGLEIPSPKRLTSIANYHRSLSTKPSTTGDFSDWCSLKGDLNGKC
jgi:hypothetical protein